MKRTLLLFSAFLLSVVAGVQTSLAQKVTLYLPGNQAHEYDISQVDSIVFSDAPATVEPEEIVVTVDANGNADGGHLFFRIDDTTFLIDELKYKYENGALMVIGYDQVFFSGEAKIISKLIYSGRIMNVVGIGYHAFHGCSSLTSVTIPNSVTSIGRDAFSDCSSLTSVTIPNSVTSIGDDAFLDCSSLTFVTIPESVTSISNYVFSGCSGLTSITIPNSVTSIGNYAFQRCSGLTSITIPNSVTTIGTGAFTFCSSLISVTIPDSVTSIGGSAFWACDGLTTITIGSGVTSIVGGAFRYCSSLTDVYCYAENVPSTNSSAFSNSSISSATLHVPVGSVDAYKAAEPWKNFGSIVAIE